MVDQMRQRVEALGPSERILTTLTTLTDHLVHNRPGIVVKDATQPIGVQWSPATWREKDGIKSVFRKDKLGKKTVETLVGTLDADGKTVKGPTGRAVAEFRMPGLYPEVAAWMYRQVADVFRVDNEFVARWASWSFPQEHRDLKVVLAGFLLVQDRKGEPIVEDGKVSFHDDDYRDVGEAMCLLRAKHDLDPKLLLRVGHLLKLPEVAAINRELGFGKSARNPALGRWPSAVAKWLRNREQNPRMLEGLVRAGFKSTVKELCREIGYKPESPSFFSVLGWKQAQAKDGRRTILGVEVKVDSWKGLSEKAICEKITKEKPNYKTIVGKLPSEVGLTRAIMTATIEAGCLSDSDLIILTPTLEELGLLQVKSVADRHQKALDTAENQRATNIARNVKSVAVQAKLQASADGAAQKAMAEVTKDMRIYVMVDRSGSMTNAIEEAKGYLKQLLVGFPLERLHVSAFESIGKEITLKAATAAAVDNAFKGITADGGTSYSNGLQVLVKHKPKANEDVLMIWIGDEQGEHGTRLAQFVRDSGLNPTAFGLMHVGGPGSTVKDAAVALGVPCFNIDKGMFKDDPYSVTRILQRLIASTPAGKRPAGFELPKRETLIEQVLKTELLKPPVWAKAA